MNPNTLKDTLKRISREWVSVFIASLALATSASTGWSSYRENTLKARPHLYVSEMFAPSSPRLGLVVSNGGPGVAFIDQFALSLSADDSGGDVPLSGDWRSQWEYFRTKTHTKDWTNVGALLPNDVLIPSSSAAEILIIVDERKFKSVRDAAVCVDCGVKGSPAQRVRKGKTWENLSQDLKAAVNRLTVTISYHSAYGEVFKLVKKGDRSQEFFRQNGQDREGHPAWINWRPGS